MTHGNPENQLVITLSRDSIKQSCIAVVIRSSLVNMFDFDFVASHLYDVVCLCLDIGVGVKGCQRSSGCDILIHRNTVAEVLK